ncbi:hypothetical protein DFH08DRAFT_832006 [Mycena albidolilacea]|uniref:Uncharacterized protein n=1 Tax=Mycena albidolilacea TaxID=1033008 RepID=A0AAD7F6N4_9AGAR|nr:hypothetical protein DFH08DRAFT_832006 [Mycena albidolilacea]
MHFAQEVCSALVLCACPTARPSRRALPDLGTASVPPGGRRGGRCVRPCTLHSVEKEFPEKVSIKKMKISQGAVPCEAGILAGIWATKSDADRAPRIVEETFSGLRGGGIIPSLQHAQSASTYPCHPLRTGKAGWQTHPIVLWGSIPCWQCWVPYRNRATYLLEKRR